MKYLLLFILPTLTPRHKATLRCYAGYHVSRYCQEWCVMTFHIDSSVLSVLYVCCLVLCIFGFVRAMLKFVNTEDAREAPVWVLWMGVCAIGVILSVAGMIL